MKFKITPKLIFIQAFLFLCTLSLAQKKDYSKQFSEGSFLLLEENYPMALKVFQEAYEIDSSSANINYKLGLCYINSASEKNKAERFFNKAILNTSKTYDDLEPGVKVAPIQAFYYLGKAQHLNGKFDEAIANFEKYKTFIPNKKVDQIKEIDYLISSSKNAKEYIANPTKVTITNLGDTVNSEYPDYSPVISADESILAFTSRRETSSGGFKTISNEFFEDIYISTKKPDGSWTSPVGIDENINTNGNEATVNLTADGQQLIIYKDDNGDGNLYTSNLEGERWSAPLKLGSDINSQHWETHACISADGNTLYFVSDRPGGLGGRDIYKCVKLPNGKWSLAKNVGPTINTEYDEDAVFIHPDQITLFFSSKGHKTMGGFDIFFSTVSPDGRWSEPTNIGYPINTTDDDIFYVVSTDGKRAYYSSVQEGGHGEKDIYLINFEQGAKVQPIALLVGKIVVPEGETLSSENEIYVTDIESGQVSNYKANTKTGKYILSLIPGKTYELSYRIADKEFYHETFSVPGEIAYQEIEREVSLKPIVIEKPKPAEPAKEEKAEVLKLDSPQLCYDIFYKANVNEIDQKSERFTLFLDAIISYVNASGNIKLIVESSASRVPTKKYKNNINLAEVRSKKAEEKILNSLKAKGFDTSKVSFEQKNLVGGPAYKNDFDKNKKAYEKHQYTKIYPDKE